MKRSGFFKRAAVAGAVLAAPVAAQAQPQAPTMERCFECRFCDCATCRKLSNDGRGLWMNATVDRDTNGYYPLQRVIARRADGKNYSGHYVAIEDWRAMKMENE